MPQGASPPQRQPGRRLETVAHRPRPRGKQATRRARELRFVSVPMKIAQIAPLAESVPPRLYGGTERVVSYLAEELVRLGHDVTLFATADSETGGELVACAPRALRLSEVQDPAPYYALMLERVRSRAAEFDVLHFHLDHVHLPLFRPFARRTVTTLHGRLDVPPLAALYREFSDMPVVSISNSQRAA